VKVVGSGESVSLGRDGRRTQAERTATTRAAIVGSARRLFAERGYAQTGLDEVVQSAGVTRGALYHHFETKADLFAAVVDLVDDELLRNVLGAVDRAGGPTGWIRQAARAYVEVGARSGDDRIAADVASVLGPESYREISATRCLPMAQLAAEAATAAGVSLPGDPDVLAAMLLGALNEAVSLLAHDPDSQATGRVVLGTVDALLDRFLGPS
jgi:AcrR family transcriptional regulator